MKITTASGKLMLAYSDTAYIPTIVAIEREARAEGAAEERERLRVEFEYIEWVGDADAKLISRAKVRALLSDGPQEHAARGDGNAAPCRCADPDASWHNEEPVS